MGHRNFEKCRNNSDRALPIRIDSDDEQNVSKSAECTSNHQSLYEASAISARHSSLTDRIKDLEEFLFWLRCGAQAAQLLTRGLAAQIVRSWDRKTVERVYRQTRWANLIYFLWFSIVSTCGFLSAQKIKISNCGFLSVRVKYSYESKTRTQFGVSKRFTQWQSRHNLSSTIRQANRY